MYLNHDIILTLAGLTLTFYALFARMLVRFDDRYSRNLLYFLLINMVAIGFTVVLVLSSIKKGTEQDLIYPIDILDVSWASALVTVVLFATILLNRELKGITDIEERNRRRKTVILIIIFGFVLFLGVPVVLTII